MARLRRVGIDTQSEHVVFIHEATVRAGELGFKPMDRVRVIGQDPNDDAPREITGVLNFCRDSLVAEDEIGLSEVAFLDLGLEPGTSVTATLARPPDSVEHVRCKLRGSRLSRSDFDEILADVVERRYSKTELAMFVLACALQNLDETELIDFTWSMVARGASLDFGDRIVADKHCIGGVPGNRTTMILVPILVSLGLTVPKTSSRAITSAAGTADTMGTLAEVELSASRLHDVVNRVGGCIAWGGALDLAPADDILITVERPMEIDTEAQMVASILAKKKTAGATHTLIDVPVGPSAKVRTPQEAQRLASLFRHVASALGLETEVVMTEAHGPIGHGIGPRLEALDVLSVLRCEPDAPLHLREKSLYLAARLLERVGAATDSSGYRVAQQALDSGGAAKAFDAILDAQGRRNLPPAARFQSPVTAVGDGRICEIDCLEITRIAKLAGAPAHQAAGVRIVRGVGDVVSRGDPIYEVHAQSKDQIDFALDYAASHPGTFRFGY